jgi:hypothetical protein
MQMHSKQILDRLGLRWSRPIPLTDAVRGAGVPAQPGLYRIRRAGLPAWDYIGQTGSGTMNLRKRMAMLKGIYADQMPYRDPHTAGPGVWALPHQTGQPLEVALCPVVGTTPWRKGLEAVGIALYRQEHGASPTVNFGRMPPGYRMSSANNAKLVAAQKRFRGGPCDDIEQSHGSEIPPIASLDPDITYPSSCGHAWSAWTPMTPEGIGAIGPGIGLYRIGGNKGLLVYIGEGSIRARLATTAPRNTSTATRSRPGRLPSG